MCAVLSVIKELEAESTLVHQAYPILEVHLHTLLSHGVTHLSSPHQMSQRVLDLLDENDCSTTVADLRGYYTAVADKWKETIERNLCDALLYTNESCGAVFKW